MFPVLEIQELINKTIQKESELLAVKSPENLYLPVQYILNLKGKKLRPALVLLSYNLFSDDIEKALPAAMAVEVFHNFTLLHDDIMDKADLRRNQPTAHIKFGENAAILSGDVMSFISFRYLLQSETPRMKELLQLFADTAVEVCEGQQFDIDFETSTDVSAEKYLNMIKLKTAVLLGCSLKAGGLLANADLPTTDDLYNFGINLGLAFQLQDDLLDSYGDENTFGKKIGGDIVSNKKTFLLIKALEFATPIQKQELWFLLNKKDTGPRQKIEAVKAIFDQLGVKQAAMGTIAEYIEKADRSLQNIKVEKTKKQPLQSLLETVATRDY